MMVPLVQSSMILPFDRFWNAVLLYYKRPHIVNRKLAATTSSILCQLELPLCIKVQDIFRKEAILYEYRKFKNQSDIKLDFVKNLTEGLGGGITITECNWDQLEQSFNGVFVAIRILIARRSNQKCVEVVIFNIDEKTVTFQAVQERDQSIIAPPFPYHLKLDKSGVLQIILNEFEDADTPSADWIADKLFPKLLKFTETIVDDGNTNVQSLSLVEPADYCETYNQLKLKYGKNLVDEWPKYEKTDPQKFVFEDFAIASYLITFWRKIGATDIKFIDAGCGNGLLVYLLNKENFNGFGLDLRKRRIWDYLDPNNDILKEGAVLPDSIFPDCTWIIGNHSDELSPWIPVIALKSSSKSNFFLLPCCSYDFSGRKYIRTNSKLSQYGDYLNYIRDIGLKCGFLDIKVDKLRIPSTKRTCLIGQSTYNSKSSEIIREVESFIEIRMNSKFTVKNPIEDVRNCTKLDRDLIKRIVITIVSKLLASQDFIKHWNKGGRVDFKQLSQIIPREDLLNLKKENGGLQTLIKNHRYIFKIEDGFVMIREPVTIFETEKYREKPCWFHLNHPNGCLYDKETCACRHD